MISFEQLATRYFPDLELINTWVQLAQYWTQKNDTILAYNETHELFYSYLLYSLTEYGFTLVIEEEKNIPLLRKKFELLSEFVFLSTKDTAESQKKAIANIQNNSAKVVVASVQRFFQKGNKFLEYLKTYQVQQIAIHNAHKISHWGEFQEIYSGFTQLKSYLKHVPIIAVLPIFTDPLKKDLTTTLYLYEPAILCFNTLPEHYTYFVFTIRPDYTVEDIIQDIAKKHSSEKGILINAQKESTLPNNLSLQFFSGETTFAIYIELPENLEQIYFLQKEYGIHTIYVIYDEKLLEKKKTAIQHAFKQKLHQEIAVKRFENVIQWCITETCKKQMFEKYWNIPVSEPCKKCDVCLAEQKSTVHEQIYMHDIQKLKDLLITKRVALAKSHNILVHQVFSDIAIEEMATYLPQNKEDLTLIAGLGTKKIEQYGDTILDTILDFCESNHLSDNMNSIRKQRTIKDNNIKIPSTTVSVVKKAKIKAAVQEVGFWNTQLLFDMLRNDGVTLAEIESVLPLLY